MFTFRIIAKLKKSPYYNLLNCGRNALSSSSAKTKSLRSLIHRSVLFCSFRFGYSSGFVSPPGICRGGAPARVGGCDAGCGDGRVGRPARLLDIGLKLSPKIDLNTKAPGWWNGYLLKNVSYEWKKHGSGWKIMLIPDYNGLSYRNFFSYLVWNGV